MAAVTAAVAVQKLLLLRYKLSSTLKNVQFLRPFIMDQEYGRAGQGTCLKVEQPEFDSKINTIEEEGPLLHVVF